ncbi:DUF6415 family natural product biosynthesis protein [Streptomyces griseoluteus]
MNGTDAPQEAPLSTVMVRASATWFMDQPTLLRHERVKALDQPFQQQMWQLIPHIERMAASLPKDDGPAKVALVL